MISRAAYEAYIADHTNPAKVNAVLGLKDQQIANYGRYLVEQQQLGYMLKKLRQEDQKEWEARQQLQQTQQVGQRKYPGFKSPPKVVLQGMLQKRGVPLLHLMRQPTTVPHLLQLALGQAWHRLPPASPTAALAQEFSRHHHRSFHSYSAHHRRLNNRCWQVPLPGILLWPSTAQRTSPWHCPL